jgi:hypothetical protein
MKDCAAAQSSKSRRILAGEGALAERTLSPIQIVHQAVDRLAVHTLFTRADCADNIEILRGTALKTA